MPNTESNGGLSLEVLLAAAKSVRADETPDEGASAAEQRADLAEKPASDATAQDDVSAAAGTDGSAAASAVDPRTEAAEEPKPSAPAFDLAAALGYGPREDEPAAPARREQEEKFDLAAALGYRSQETIEHEATEAAQAEAMDQARAVQERALREAQQQARLREREAQRQARLREREAAREERIARGEEPSIRAAHEPQPRENATSEAAQRMADRRTERKRTVRPTTGLGAQSVADAAATSIESYQPSKRDRSAQARAARPMKQEEVTEVAQAIAAEAARTEYVEKQDDAAKEKPVEATAPVTEQPKEASTGAFSSATAEERFVRPSDQPAAPLGEPIMMPAPEPEPAFAPAPEAAPAMVEQPMPSSPAVQEPVSVPQAGRSASQAKPIDFTSAEFASSIVAGAPETSRAAKSPEKPPTTPHKVPVRTTEEIIRPVGAPVQLGVISPEVARHEAETKKKAQSNERKIVKKVRRFRALGMLFIVVALAALAGAIFLFVAGNAQASESIESAATEIAENSSRTITYRYKAADSNGTLCPTTEVATFSAGDVLEQSVITMNTPDFETAAHTLANFKKQFLESAYVDGRVDGSTVIFTLHMSNEHIMKTTYTALLMTNTTGCEVII